MTRQVMTIAWAMGLVCTSVALAVQPAEEPESQSFMPRCPTEEELREATRPISAIRARMSVDPSLIQQEGLPLDCSHQVFQRRRPARALFPTVRELNWAPSDFFHQPLYFDDQPLERYGQTVSPLLQPFLSGGRFFLTIPIVPYKIGLDRPHEHVSTLAYARAGGYVPCVRERIVPHLDAALLEAGTAVGLIFLLP